MLRSASLAFALALSFGSPGELASQADTPGIIVSAIHALRAEVPVEGRVVLERSIPGAHRVSKDAARQRSPSETETLARAAGIHASSATEVVLCPDATLDTCRLADGAAASIAVGDPAVRGDSAAVVGVVRHLRPGARQAVARATYQVSLVRQNGEWTVREVALESIT